MARDERVAGFGQRRNTLDGVAPLRPGATMAVNFPGRRTAAASGSFARELGPKIEFHSGATRASV